MKSKVLKKAMALAISAACMTSSVIIGNMAFAAEQVYEFEDGTMSAEGRVFEGKDKDGNDVKASGDKFVFLQDGGETVSVKVNAPSTGMYAFTMSVYAPYGDKIQNLLINGVDQGQISFVENTDGFRDIELGSFKLNEGENTVTIKSSWGWSYIDCLKVKEATLPKLTATKSLTDSKATDETKRLMCYLADNYGSHILSGQQEIYKYGPHDFEYEFDYIKTTTGKTPVIRGFDYLNSANILYGSDDGTTDRMIDWAKNKNGIVTASWHVTVPKQFASYEQGVTKVDWAQATYDPKETDFDTSKAVVEGTKENKYYMACLEALAGEIKKLQDAKVPIILRPLHEAEGSGGEKGSWFWWGKSGSAVYKELWKLTYDTLVKKYDLHNIIWEWNSYAYKTSPDWYPGDEYVDLIAYDKYNCTDWSTGNPVLNHNDSAISGTFYNIVEMYDGKKMVAMSENDSIPTIENILAEKAGWLYFCPWYDGGSDSNNFLSNPVFNKAEDLKNMYTSDYCVTLDEVPADLYNTYSLEGFGNTVEPETQPTAQPETKPATEPTEERPTEPTEPAVNPTGGESFGTAYMVSINSLPDKVEYKIGEELDLTGLTVDLMLCTNGTPISNIVIGESPLEMTDTFIIDDSKFNSSKAGTYEITIGATSTFNTYRTPIPAVFEVKVSGNTTQPTEPGTQPTVPPTQEVKASKYGDVDENGTVELADVTKLSKYLLNKELFALGEVGKLNADVNHDKKVDSLDLSKLLEYNLGQITEKELG